MCFARLSLLRQLQKCVQPGGRSHQAEPGGQPWGSQGHRIEKRTVPDPEWLGVCHPACLHQWTHVRMAGYIWKYHEEWRVVQLHLFE